MSTRLKSLQLTPAAVGSSIDPIKCPPKGWATNNSGLSTAAASCGNSLTHPQDLTDLPTGVYVFELAPRIRACLSLLASHDTDPAAIADITGRAWLTSEIPIPSWATPPSKDTNPLQSEFQTGHAFDLACTIGNASLDQDSLLTHIVAGVRQVCKYADAFTITNDHTVGGVTKAGESADCIVEAIFDHASARFMILQLDRGATAAGVLPLLREY